ncbi:MAG: NgoFVII family restriction endonuclease [Ignavibacteria bacterium]|nr:NgoFVII family restriction endonuclease [Ignavibacteria bacterium]
MPNLTHIKISFLDRNGNLPKISGLNWGQRAGREKNQAYIKLPSNVYHSNFFPPIGVRFVLETDDGRSFTCTRAQANGKAIETPENNSLLGLYFRRRLNLNRGVLVEKQHLLDYGRTDLDIFKVSENTYRIDFSV